MNTAKEDEVRTHSRIAFRVILEFCDQMLDQMLDQQKVYQVVNQHGRLPEFLRALSIGTKVLDLRPAILAIIASILDLSISIFTT